MVTLSHSASNEPANASAAKRPRAAGHLSADSLLFTPERRLRAPWRVLIFVLAAVLGTLVAAIVERMVVSGAAALGYRLLITQWSAPLGLLLAHLIVLKSVDGRQWDFVGLHRLAARPALLAQGTALGALTIGIPSAILLLTGQLDAVPSAPGSSLAAAGVTFANLLPAAFSEELLLRGYVFAVLRESIGWRWTLISTSVVFGLLHIANPGANGQSVLLVMLAGMFLGAIFIATGSLYAATLAHFAWNWFMAAALHTPVSGLPVSAPDYRVVDSGPDWLTGGGWGPEGGIAAALGMFVALIYLNWRLMRRTER